MERIGIAGGSGAGKSTLAYNLVDSAPDIFDVINFDDYQKLKTDADLPMVDSMINFDHPQVILWDKLIDDLALLEKGQILEIQTWDNRSNVDFQKHGIRITRQVFPKKVIIVEGYLSLWHPKLRALYDRKYFLDLNLDERLKRRQKFLYPEYRDRVLIPMHNEHVEPTKNYADRVFDTASLTPGPLLTQVIDDLRQHGII